MIYSASENSGNNISAKVGNKFCKSPHCFPCAENIHEIPKKYIKAEKNDFLTNSFWM